MLFAMSDDGWQVNSFLTNLNSALFGSDISGDIPGTSLFSDKFTSILFSFLGFVLICIILGYIYQHRILLDMNKSDSRKDMEFMNSLPPTYLKRMLLPLISRLELEKFEETGRPIYKQNGTYRVAFTNAVDKDLANEYSKVIGSRYDIFALEFLQFVDFHYNGIIRRNRFPMILQSYYLTYLKDPESVKAVVTSKESSGQQVDDFKKDIVDNRVSEWEHDEEDDEFYSMIKNQNVAEKPVKMLIDCTVSEVGPLELQVKQFVIDRTNEYCKAKGIAIYSDGKNHSDDYKRYYKKLLKQVRGAFFCKSGGYTNLSDSFRDFLRTFYVNAKLEDFDVMLPEYWKYYKLHQNDVVPTEKTQMAVSVSNDESWRDGLMEFLDYEPCMMFPDGIIWVKSYQAFKTYADNNNEFTGIYLIFNVNKRKVYVGQGKKVIKRCAEHFREDAIYKDNVPDVRRDFNSGDRFCVNFIKLKDTDFDTIDELERHYIEKYDCVQSGYNHLAGNRTNKKSNM